MQSTLPIVGGGIAGLTAAITAAETGWTVNLHERSNRLGGQGWTVDGPFKANWGPHVIYADGPWWQRLRENRLTDGASRVPFTGTIKFRMNGSLRRIPPLAMITLCNAKKVCVRTKHSTKPSPGSKPSSIWPPRNGVTRCNGDAEPNSFTHPAPSTFPA